MLHKLMYISQGADPGEHLQNITEALDAGVKFVQLRIKNCNQAELEEYSKRAAALCESYGATFIVNDHPEVAASCGSGVHLGLGDSSVDDARKSGHFKMIGGTANSIDDIRRRFSEKVDYIGLGPFRFTTTKEKLSPVLGVKGYADILHQMHVENISLPVFAIGGIIEEDISALMRTGVFGVAVSGLITACEDKKPLVERLNKKLYAEDRG
jgi:thiamine-phosphate pyrophosphorylase